MVHRKYFKYKWYIYNFLKGSNNYLLGWYIMVSKVII